MLKIQILLIIFGTSEGAGTAILTFLGGFHPQTQALWLTDIAHHHLAIGVVFILLVICTVQTGVLVTV
jgi:hypothetical protein